MGRPLLQTGERYPGTRVAAVPRAGLPLLQPRVKYDVIPRPSDPPEALHPGALRLPSAPALRAGRSLPAGPLGDGRAVLELRGGVRGLAGRTDHPEWQDDAGLRRRLPGAAAPGGAGSAGTGDP